MSAGPNFNLQDMTKRNVCKNREKTDNENELPQQKMAVRFYVTFRKKKKSESEWLLECLIVNFYHCLVYQGHAR